MYRITFIFILMITISANVFSQEAATTQYRWQAGTSEVKITPEESMWMGGYAARDHPSEGTLHDLWAKALALEDAKGKRVVLVAMDLVAIPKDISDNIRDRLKENFGLEREQIMLNVSHTHTGPEIRVSKQRYALDENEVNKIRKYAANLEDQIVDLVRRALKSMQPAQLFSDNGLTRFQVNRRNNEERELRSYTELKGPNDYAVPVIKVMSAKDEMKAILFGYACHNTVLSDYNWSGDYAGFAQIELEKRHPGTTALFFQGAGGDQNPLPRRSVSLAQQYGRELAAAVDRVLNEKMQPLSSRLLLSYSEVDIKFAEPSPTKADLKDIMKEDSDYPDYLKHSAKVLLKKLEKGESLMTSYPYPIQVWKVGEQPIFALGGELLVGYAIDLKRIFGQDIFVFGYSNDVMAYIPTATVLHEGGYEGTRSPIFTTPWASNIEEVIVEEAVRLAKQIGMQQISLSN